MKRVEWFHIVLVVFWLGACSSSDDAAPTPDPTTDFACQLAGYPCTLGEVGDDLLDRSDALLAEAKARVESGGTYPEVLAWIESHGDVAEAFASERGLFFRIEGGVPTWLLEVPERAEADPNDQNVGWAPATPLRSVVGRGTRRDADAPHKDALILAPFTYDWPGSASENAVELFLATLPDYDGRITKKQNTTRPPKPSDVDTSTGNVKVSDFQGWREYDVIYVSSHAGVVDADHRVCDTFLGVQTEWCLISVGVGERIAGCRAAKRLYPSMPGVRCVAVTGHPGAYLSVTTDFFHTEYGLSITRPGLERALVYIDACHSYFDDGLMRNLAGTSSAFFGWDSSLGCSFGATVTTQVFNHLTDGLTAREAHRRIKADGVDPEGGAELALNSAGDDLRIREIVTARRPSGAALGALSAIRDGDGLSIIGIPGDGENDRLELIADVTGVFDPDRPGGPVGAAQTNDPAELYHLRFLVDDADIGFDNLGEPRNETASVTQLDELTHRYRYTAELPFDVPEGGTDVELGVEVELPEGGTSIFTADVRLAGSAWRMSVDGAYFAGTYEGDEATFHPATGFSFSTDETGGDFSVIVQAQPDELSGEPPPGDSSYTLGYDVASDSSIDFVNTTRTPPLDLTLFNGDGVSTSTQPDGSTLDHPPEARLDIRGFAEDADTISGTIQGTYMACYGAYDPGPEGYCGTYEVVVEFSAENQFQARSAAGRRTR